MADATYADENLQDDAISIPESQAEFDPDDETNDVFVFGSLSHNRG